MMYRNIHSSLMRFCQEFIDSLEDGDSPQFQNFDATWDDAELPNTDLCGYFALTYEVNDQFVEGSFQVGYSTREDRNLFRLVSAMDRFITTLLPTNKITIYDADTGSKLGLMVIKNGTRIMPVSGSKNRPVQFIAVSFITTVTYELPSEIVEFVL